ncbi:MAG: hypothetical protein NTZ16_11825 [Verrucomicrobia bacterium]|nr:hypothetical protein [Verrucomicrobiota bacterium]
MSNDQTQNQGKVIESGFGIVVGPTEPPSGAGGIVIAFMFAAALLGVGIKIFDSARGLGFGAWYYIVGGLVLLLGLIFAIGGIVSLMAHLKTPQKKPTGNLKSFTESGIWVTADCLYAGKFTFEFRDEVSYSSIDSLDSIPLSRVTWLQDGNGLMLDGRKASPGMQVVNSKYNATDFRIARLLLMEGSESRYIINMMVKQKIMIADCASATSFTKKPLLNQFQRIADQIKQYRSKSDACTLLITPRGGDGGLLLFGAIGGIFKSFADIQKATQVRKDLQSGQFVDKPTGELVLKLIEEEGWTSHIRSLQVNELGLIGGEW